MILFAFFWGACIGSFLNVIILRLQGSQHSFWTKRSYCFHCHNTILWRDLIPIVSWFWLRGRCRFCRARISPRYMIVEIITGVLAATCWSYGASLIQAIDMFAFCALLIAIGLIDLDSWLIPAQLPALLILLGLGFGYIQGQEVVLERLIGLVAGFGALALFVILSSWVLRKIGRISSGEYAMGWGDPLLLGAIGANLGWFPLPFLVTLASVQAVVLYGFFAWARKPFPDDDWVPPERSMPFGPFLALAGIEIGLHYLIS